MSKNVIVRFADITIGIKTDSDYMKHFCKDYLSDGEPLFFVSTTDEAIKKEMENTDEPTTPGYAEALCIYREIAEKIPLYDRLVFHGAAIEYNGKAYIFTAPSGTGKTTHIGLWKKYLGDKVKVINGDKPIISNFNSTITVYGTSYAGKERWQTNSFAPLCGICFLSQGKDNAICPISPSESFTKLYLQAYKPYTKEAMEKTISIIRSLCLLPCFSLSCDMSEQAVKASFEALTNEKYTEKK